MFGSPGFQKGFTSPLSWPDPQRERRNISLLYGHGVCADGWSARKGLKGFDDASNDVQIVNRKE